ncbi:sigma-70 family RNA polymerase sigma factor [Streptomyces nodosus]|uniref:sigma-70 family RNA polymerase sigma factor n=1 Tax=Streptomyces nodosus TaxID=40318 RepID=UPI0009A0FB9E|nr:sigma-70 family RNA polymerase sigma factor [Streptomyces nodosus]MBB4794616.1 RNA polymerase sigma-70 factor (ECF subfamily) [Streptomyces nodosus]
MNTTVVDAATAEHQAHLLQRLVTDHTKALLAYAEKLLNDRHTAEDVVQETFIRAWPNAERLYSTQGSVRGWLLTVTRNLVVDRMRSAASRHETVGAEDLDAFQPDHADGILTTVEAVTLLRRLSHEHREVLLHTYLCGRTVKETARILGIPAGTVKSRQHYALSSLRSKAAAVPRNRALPA